MFNNLWATKPPIWTATPKGLCRFWTKSTVWAPKPEGLPRDLSQFWCHFGNSWRPDNSKFLFQMIIFGPLNPTICAPKLQGLLSDFCQFWAISSLCWEFWSISGGPRMVVCCCCCCCCYMTILVPQTTKFRLQSLRASLGIFPCFEHFGPFWAAQEWPFWLKNDHFGGLKPPNFGSKP